MTLEDCKAGRKVNLVGLNGDDYRRVVRVVDVTDDGRVVVRGKRFTAAVHPWELQQPYRTGRRVKER